MSRIDKAIEMAAKVNQSKQERPETATGKAAFNPTVLGDVTPLSVSDPSLVTVHEPYGLVTEEFNKLRAMIMRLSNSKSRQNTLLVTSSVPGEGKTTTAVNLALSMARSTDYTVLLVDADFRRPKIHELFNIEVGPGFVHCLRDNMPIEKALVKTGHGNLDILPAGQQVEDPLELLSSKHMQQLVQDIKARYPDRYVIFDSPPVLPFADARVMGALMDGTIFVTRENYSRIKQIKEGLEYLLDSHILGVVCNDTSLGIGRNYGSYYN